MFQWCDEGLFDTGHSGIGKGVIGASPPQSPYTMASPSPSSPKTSRHPPRPTHQPVSTIHTPRNLSPAPSARVSRRPSTTTSPNPPSPLCLPRPTDGTTAPTSPSTLFSVLTSLLETVDRSELDAPISSPSTWSFLNDANYIHPLLYQPPPTSCHSLASSTGLLLKTTGLKVTAIKIDPYMNIDAGTMAPTEHGESAHSSLLKLAKESLIDLWLEILMIELTILPLGEVYVLNDGGETDLDLGNYERYLNISLGRDNNITTGKVYQHVISREVSRSSNLSEMSYDG